MLERIEEAIRESERSHDGELRFAVGGGPARRCRSLRGLTPRERAREVFAQLAVWDTEDNSGVLIYLQLVDRDIEIVADRGISAKVEQATWDAICRRMEEAFRAGPSRRARCRASRRSPLLARHFPPAGANPNELPDRPVVL